jgi:hypothetical protein
MVEPGDYVDGVTIRWGRVASTLFGATIFAYFQGTVATFLSLVDIPLGLVGGLGEFLGQFVAVVLGLWPALIRGGWAGAAGFAASAGIAGYAVAIGLVLVAFYIGTRVISYATN